MTAAVDLDDIQGNILRGYRLSDVRHIAIELHDGATGRSLLQALLDGTSDIPAVETASDWTTKPDVCVNVSLTWNALLVLGVPKATAAHFPIAYKEGSATRSMALKRQTGDPWSGVGLGDVRESAPHNWSLGKDPTLPLVLVTIFADDPGRVRRDKVTTAISSLLGSGASIVWQKDGHTFSHNRVHFGYRDGIAQPQIEGRPGRRVADMQPDAPTGDFLLGKDYVNTYRGNFLGRIPNALGDNGTYLAFRVLQQDCDAFETFVQATSSRWDMSPEMVKAKMVGRWDDGTPLTMWPSDLPRDGVAVNEAELNNFDYSPTDDHPTYYDDIDGLRCPYSSHVRRMNPRGGAVTGLQHNRRIVRRGVPYGAHFPTLPPDADGPDHVPEDPDGRGLLGMFICADLESQFEFLQKMWANSDISAPMVRGTRDPIIGWQPEAGGLFQVPSGDLRGQLSTTDLPRLVTTLGSLYLFMPGIGGLRTLAREPW